MGDHENMLEQGAEGTADYLPIARVLPRVVSHSPPTLRVGIHLAPTRFPSRRDTAIAQSLPSMLSTWSLATAAGDVDGYIEPRPDPHGRDELGGGESGPQDPSVRGELQDRSKHTTNDLAGRNGMLSLPSEDQSTLFQRVIRKAKKFMKSKLVLAL